MTTKSEAVEEQGDVKAAKKEPVKPVSSEPQFHLHQLREHSRELFGVKPEVFDGVFAKAKETMTTKSEAESRIKAFLKKEVK